MRRRIVRCGGMGLLAVFVVSQASPSAQDLQRTYQAQARTLDRFMTVVDSVQRVDPTDEAAVERMTRDLQSMRPQSLAEAYVARIVLAGAANAELERGVRGEIRKVGVGAFATRMRSDSRYTGSVAGASAAVAEMRTAAARMAARTQAAADHLEPAATTRVRRGQPSGAEVEAQGLLTIVFGLHVEQADDADLLAQSAEAAESLQNEREQRAREAVEAVAACLETAKTRLDACTQGVDDNPSPVAAINTAAKAACTHAFLTALAACTGMP